MDSFQRELAKFREFGKKTKTLTKAFGDLEVPYYINEFWTARQRVAHSLHEISYRACFKPQLPRFFIERLTAPGDVVYDPFMGRGTSLMEALLCGRRPIGCDINPLSPILCEPRLQPPTLSEITTRLVEISTSPKGPVWKDLLVFYHPETLRQITALREYLLARQEAGELDIVDRWIRMVATNRLTGHSSGFFSVYTLPPNQAVSVESQQRINQLRDQKAEKRDIAPLILKKSRALLRSFELRSAPPETSGEAMFVTGSADSTPEIPDATVQLVTTSPPFLDVVNYKKDNWLRCWFNGIDPDSVQIWHFRDTQGWQAAMTRVFSELHRVLKPGGFVAFEVGEVRGGKILLEDLVVPAGVDAGLQPVAVVINDQEFTKTSNCWGVDNLTKGTNTNRIVLFTRPK